MKKNKKERTKQTKMYINKILKKKEPSISELAFLIRWAEIHGSSNLKRICYERFGRQPDIFYKDFLKSMRKEKQK